MAERWLGLVRYSVVASVALASGCNGVHSYRPATPVVAATSSATLELDQLARGDGLVVFQPDTTRANPGTTVRVRWRAPREGLGISRAYLVPPEAAPCTLGLNAEVIDVDGQTRWERPVDLGRDHEVTFAFPEDGVLENGPLALDVEVTDAGGATCVRVPIAGGGQRQVPVSALAVGSFVGLGFPLRGGATPTLRGDAAVGRWIGPLRLTLRLGMGYGNTRVGREASGEGTASSSFIDLHVAPELAFFPVVRGAFALGLVVALDVGSAFAGAGTATDPEREIDWWGPRVGVILGSVHVAPLGAPPHRPAGGQGVEISLSRPSSWPGDRNGRAAYVLGVGISAW